MNQDEWIKDGPVLTAPQVLEQLRRTIDSESALVVEHRFYRGARAPHRFVCDDYEDLAAYLATQTSAGDAFLLWRFEDCCTDKSAMASGKIPDVEGRVPRGGAY
jgi:hypothetical protein